MPSRHQLHSALIFVYPRAGVQVNACRGICKVIVGLKRYRAGCHRARLRAGGIDIRAATKRYGWVGCADVRGRDPQRLRGRLTLGRLGQPACPPLPCACHRRHAIGCCPASRNDGRRPRGVMAGNAPIILSRACQERRVAARRRGIDAKMAFAQKLRARIVCRDQGDQRAFAGGQGLCIGAGGLGCGPQDHRVQSCQRAQRGRV